MRKYIYLLIIALLSYCGYNAATRDNRQEVLYAQADLIIDQRLEDSLADWGYDNINATTIQLYEPSMLESSGVMSQLMSKIPKINFDGYCSSKVDLTKALSIYNFLTIRIRGSSISYLFESAYTLPIYNPKQNLIRGREPTYLYARGIRHG